MKPARAGIAFVLVVAGASARAADPAFVPTDFAWGRAVETQASGPLQTLLLDVSVYRGAVSPDLADLRVFNAAGEVVPHAIRPLGDPSEEQDAPVPVPLFHVPEGSSLARGAERGTTVRERELGGLGCELDDERDDRSRELGEVDQIGRGQRARAARRGE